jgi:hypothetical protein
MGPRLLAPKSVNENYRLAHPRKGEARERPGGQNRKAGAGFPKIEHLSFGNTHSILFIRIYEIGGFVNTPREKTRSLGISPRMRIQIFPNFVDFLLTRSITSDMIKMKITSVMKPRGGVLRQKTKKIY